MTDPRKYGTKHHPELVKKNAAKIKASNLKKLEALKAKYLRNGQYALFGVAAILLITFAMTIVQLGIELVAPWFIGMMSVLVVGYVVMGILYHKKPLEISIIGLSIYLLWNITLAAFDATTIFAGILWKVIIIVSLIRAIQQAKDLKKTTTQIDLLDDIMIE